MSEVHERPSCVGGGGRPVTVAQHTKEEANPSGVHDDRLHGQAHAYERHVRRGGGTVSALGCMTILTTYVFAHYLHPCAMTSDAHLNPHRNSHAQGQGVAHETVLLHCREHFFCKQGAICTSTP